MAFTNTVYYGDNLDIPRRYIREETVDLIRLGPPFNGNASCNVLLGGRRLGGRCIEETCVLLWFQSQ
jgi:hypothetical protein